MECLIGKLSAEGGIAEFSGEWAAKVSAEFWKWLISGLCKDSEVCWVFERWLVENEVLSGVFVTGTWIKLS